VAALDTARHDTPLYPRHDTEQGLCVHRTLASEWTRGASRRSPDKAVERRPGPHRLPICRVPRRPALRPSRPLPPGLIAVRTLSTSGAEPEGRAREPVVVDEPGDLGIAHADDPSRERT